MRETLTRWGLPRAFAVVVASAAAGVIGLTASCQKKDDGANAAPEAASASATPTAAASAPVPEAASAAASADTAEPASTGASSATAKASPSSTAQASPSGSAAAGAKTYDCGAKGQKPCPMQGWMKSVMASASSSGDGEKLASALTYVAGKPPPGFGNWTSIANGGVAKAKAGDIDGAKTACKQCHDAYKDKYKSTMRDRPF